MSTSTKSHFKRAYDYAMQNGVDHERATTRASAAEGLLQFHTGDAGIQRRLIEMGFTNAQARSLVHRQARDPKPKQRKARRG